MVTTNGSHAHMDCLCPDIRYSGYGLVVLDIMDIQYFIWQWNGRKWNYVSIQLCRQQYTCSDILEPNDTQATATQASTFPVSCTGLSIHSTLDEDLFEIQMISGVTYYTNVHFLHAMEIWILRWESLAY